MDVDQLDLFGVIVAATETPEVVGARVALRQDIDKLMEVEGYVYNLDNDAFRDYCLQRGTLYVCGKPGGRYWEYFRDCSLKLDDFLSDRGVRFAQEHNGKRHEYTPEQLRSQWVCVRIGRGKLQDTWEIWNSRIG